MKKKTKIILTVAVIGILGTSAAFALGGNSKPKEGNDNEPQIDYFTLKGSKQVFINGTVTPTRSEEFVKDPALGKLGDLEVKNGETVEKGTLLYQYIDPNSEKQIAEIKSSIQSTQADRNKAARQMQLELDKLAAVDSHVQDLSKEDKEDKEQSTPAPDVPLENTEANRESIILQYDLEGFDVRLAQLEQQLTDVLNDQVNLVKAPFKGKVSIPQEKTRDSAILNLTSEDYYVIGEVNEKDVSKLKVDQAATIQTIADKQTIKGKISYISEIPVTASTETGGSGSSLSNYTVKLALDDAKQLKNGFHVQASIDLDKQKTMIPKAAIHYDDKQAYVLVDDFGTVLKKEITLNKDNAITDKEVEVTDGLESMDKIIVKSDKKLKDGDMLTVPDETMMDEEVD